MTSVDLKDNLTEHIALLSVQGIGRGRFHSLVKTFGSIQKVFDASVNALESVSGISNSTAKEIKNNIDFDKAKELAARIIQLGWNVHFYNDDNFPKQLYSISGKDIPPILFSVGRELSPTDKLIGIVGSRHATETGKQFTFNLASQLAASGIIVVSGMAEGIDAAAHKGALESGGHTVAVWGSSLDIVYPSSNKELAKQIAEHGTIFSEYLPGTDPARAYFPERNRIIAGLSDGVIVVEAGQKSGALITAEQALTYNKELFAVPGLPSSKMSIGSNQLIKNGATLLTSIDDIFETMPRLKGEIKVKQFKQLPDMTETEQKIINLFTSGPQQVDKISREINLPVPELMEFLLALELKGIVKEISGKRFILSEDYI